METIIISFPIILFTQVWGMGTATLTTINTITLTVLTITQGTCFPFGMDLVGNTTLTFGNYTASIVDGKVKVEVNPVNVITLTASLPLRYVLKAICLGSTTVLGTTTVEKYVTSTLTFTDTYITYSITRSITLTTITDSNGNVVITTTTVVYTTYLTKTTSSVITTPTYITSTIAYTLESGELNGFILKYALGEISEVKGSTTINETDMGVTIPITVYDFSAARLSIFLAAVIALALLLRVKKP